VELTRRLGRHPPIGDAWPPPSTWIEAQEHAAADRQAEEEAARREAAIDAKRAALLAEVAGGDGVS
jgi:hypothetical protein